MRPFLELAAQHLSMSMKSEAAHEIVLTVHRLRRLRPFVSRTNVNVARLVEAKA
jgi:hypothetical protein